MIYSSYPLSKIIVSIMPVVSDSKFCIYISTSLKRSVALPGKQSNLKCVCYTDDSSILSLVTFK